MAAKLKPVLSDCPTIGDKPNQPRTGVTFPKVAFGKSSVVLRSFQPSWFDQWKWLHWNQATECAYCYVCISAFKQGKLRSSSAEHAFISKGFKNCKNATACFRDHEQSSCHKEAIGMVITIPATHKDISECISSASGEQRRHNRSCFMKVLTSLQFLARQGLPVRGEGEGELNGNLSQLLSLRSQDDLKLVEWLKKKTDKYTGHDMQNEIIQVMGHQILRQIASNIKAAGRFSIMVDETPDVSTKEQVVFALRWIDDNWSVHEDLIGLSQTDSIDSNSLVHIIQDILLRLDLKLENCRGQCYDGASNMRGCQKGVATQIVKEEPCAIYTHCYGHSLNLACQDAIRGITVLKNVLSMAFELSKLLKYSSKRNAIYQKIKNELAPSEPGFRTLCPTRWTVRADSLASIRANYSVLQNSLESFSQMARGDMENTARIQGIAAVMETFDFLFGVILGDVVLHIVDNLSRTLQHKDLSASEGQMAARLTVDTLSSLQSDEAKFESLWRDAIDEASKLEVNEPTLPRRRKAPRNVEVGQGEGYHPETPKDHYRAIYYETLDLLIAFIKDRFDQPGYRTYVLLETLLIKAAKGDDYMEEHEVICQLYRRDVDAAKPKAQLPILSTHFTAQEAPPVTFSAILSFLKNMGNAKVLLSEIVTIVRLILVMPATNATSERSFSALRRVKTYLRSTMCQARLNNLMLLHVHKEATDKLDLIACANDFVGSNSHRYNMFGKFV